MFGNLGFGEILLILVWWCCSLFGAKAPTGSGGIAREGIREFKRSISAPGCHHGSDDQQRNVPPRPMDTPPQSTPGIGRAQASLAIAERS